jgi:hypothetical protein
MVKSSLDFLIRWIFGSWLGGSLGNRISVSVRSLDESKCGARMGSEGWFKGFSKEKTNLT